MSRPVRNERPKKIIYADQIARQRKASATPSSVSPMLTDIAANLQLRRWNSRDNGAALVKWLVECGVASLALTLDGAIQEMENAPRGLLAKVAAALRGDWS